MNYKNCFISIVVIGLICGSSVLVQASLTDDRIKSTFKDSYVYKNYFKNDTVDIQSNNGEVTLTGTVEDERNRSLAQETVAGIQGVEKINNHIQVAEKTPTEPTDSWIGVKVKTALLFHRSVNPLSTKVDVKDGVVTLSGQAASQANKDLATEYAKDVQGVKDVKNDMVVFETNQNPQSSFSELVDDVSITAQVKVALLTHRSTSSISTKVDTKDGVVTLTGKAKNQAEIDLVTKLVGDINGVKSVINNMVVS